MSERKNPIAVLREAGAGKFFEGQSVEEFMREVRGGDEDALSKRVKELERTVDDLRGELAQSDRASDVTRIAELEAAINRACSGCWAKDAPDAAQCRLCGLKKETKGGVRNDRLAPLTDNGGCVAK